MKVGVIGMSCKVAQLQLRELFSKSAAKLLDNISDLAHQYHSVLLLTCNRIEIYFTAENLSNAHTELLQALRNEMNCAFEQQIYSLFGCDCFLHLGRVTAGMDSTIVSETEIQGQVKQAYESAVAYRDLPSQMHYLFQKALRVGKTVRTAYPMPQGMPNLEQAAFDLGTTFFPQFRQTKVLFVGHSEINRRILPYFKAKGVADLTLCTRSPYAAQEFALENGVKLVSWKELDSWTAYDFVVCATTQNRYLIHPVKHPVRTRCIVDLGMPRNVCPELKKDTKIHLFNIEEMGALVQKKRYLKLEQISESELLIQSLIQRYLALFQEKTNPDDHHPPEEAFALRK